MEAVYRATAMPLRMCSRQLIHFPRNPDSARITKLLSQLKDEESSDIWMPSLYDKYKARPKSLVFERMCFAEFASKQLQTCFFLKLQCKLRRLP